MKILHYTYDDVANPRCGGGGAYRELMLHRHLAHRHEIHYYTGTFPGARSRVEDGIHFSHLGWGNNYLISRITFSVCATIHSLFARSDLIVIGFSAFSPVMSFLFKPRKMIIEFYHFLGTEPFRKYGLFGVAPWLAEKAVLHFAYNYITVAKGVAGRIKEIRKGRVNVIAAYTGFDQSLLNDSDVDENFILFFGRLDVHMKGLDILIPAFETIASNYPGYNLILAGRGTESDVRWLQKRIETSPWRSRIRLIVGVDETLKRELLQTASVVCMPSRFEGFCIVAIEAAAGARPTIGTRILGLQDAIRDGKTGILVPAENVKALARAMSKLIGDPALRRRLGKAGFEWAHNFTWDKIAVIQEKFYHAVLCRNRKVF